MNNELTQKMIRRARQERTLIASLLHDYAAFHEKNWQQIAHDLRINEEQLSQLALCRRPRRKYFMEDARAIAQHTGVDEQRFAQFYYEAAQLATLPTAPSTTKSRQSSGPHTTREQGIMKVRYVFAAGLAVIALAIVGLMVFSQPEPVNATLIAEQGEVAVDQTKTLFLFVTTDSQTTLAAGDALVVRAGDHISLSAGSEARLALADGSSVELIGSADLDITELQAGEDASYRVALNMNSGRIYNRVQRLLGTEDTFEINTPSSTAAVRGTAFAVEILDPTSSFYATDEGTVAVMVGGEEVLVQAGEMLTATVGQPLEVEPQDDVTPPAITLHSPVGQPAANSEVVVSGSTEAGAVVTIDGLAVAVDANGNFEGTVVAGADGIIIEAADAAGNVTTVQIDTQ